MPTEPKVLDKYIENINPRIPVVMFDAVSKNEFFAKLSFIKAISLPLLH